jgi:hypothetical protein
LLIRNLLASKAIACANYQTAEIALNELNDETGAVILSEEALTLPDIARLAENMAEQPSWPDFPIIPLNRCRSSRQSKSEESGFSQAAWQFDPGGASSCPETLIRTVQAALRSRRRQYQTRV